MEVFCKCHHVKHERDDLYRVIRSGKNEYYCSEKIYLKLENDKVLRKECLELLNQIFGKVMINTQVQKELTEISKAHEFSKIKMYLEDNVCDLASSLNKTFNSEYAEIRYLMTIIKNSIGDYKPQKKIEVKQEVTGNAIEYIPKSNFNKKDNKKKTMLDILSEV